MARNVLPADGSESDCRPEAPEPSRAQLRALRAIHEQPAVCADARVDDLRRLGLAEAGDVRRDAIIGTRCYRSGDLLIASQTIAALLERGWLSVGISAAGRQALQLQTGSPLEQGAMLTEADDGS